MKLKIGIFDSGIGGFTILKPLLKIRKDVEIFYLEDKGFHSDWKANNLTFDKFFM